MAARGYWRAFQAMQKSLGKILKGENPGEVADADHGKWYRDLFAPPVSFDSCVLDKAQIHKEPRRGFGAFL